MEKTTVYLSEELQARLEAESSTSGVSKAELIRRGVAMLLESSPRFEPVAELPVFYSDQPKTVDEMDAAVYAHIKDRVARR